MNAKQKSSDKNEAESFVQPNNPDPELEKKVDELLSLEPVEMNDEKDSKKKSKTSDKAVEATSVESSPKPEAENSGVESPADAAIPVAPVPATPSPVVPPAPPEAAALPVAPTATSALSETAGPPLLPTEKLPELDKKKKSIVVKMHDEEPETVAPADIAEDTVREAEPEVSITDPAVEPAEEIEEPLATEPDQQIDEGLTIAQAEEQAAQEETQKDELGIESPSTDKAVDEIIAEEADELLAARDQRFSNDVTNQVEKAPKKKRRGLGSLISAWWHSKLYRNATLGLLFIGLLTTALVPTSRYYVLNTVGVRVSSTVTVLDETTGQPLKNAVFTVGEASGRTDGEGIAKLDNLKLGPTTLSVKKAAFSDVSQPVTLGWGSNPLGEYRLRAVGAQYKFTFTDFVTKSPLSKVEVQSGQADARSNEKGELTLTIPKSEAEKEEVTVEITGENYRTEKLTFSSAQKDTQSIQLVPSKKHVFISKRSGKYDVYKIDVDGKNEEIVLAGTGSEKPEATALSTHPSRDLVALVSSRDAVRNSDGFLLSTLTLIDLKDNTTTKVSDSERIQLVEWIGRKLVYVKIAEGESAVSVNRHKLISYDIDSKTEKELASTNYFNDVVAVNGSIYYSPAMYQVNGQVGLYKINSEGNNRKMILDKEAWNLFRTDYEKLSVSIGQEWYDLNLNNDSMTKVTGPPPVLKSRVYVDSPDDKSSLWTDERDGKGVLIGVSKDSKEEKVLQTLGGLKNPVRWLDSGHIIFRVATNHETADYVMGSSGGEARKIRDVTDTAGIDRWYYY